MSGPGESEGAELLNLDHARSPEQAEYMQKLEAEGVCPFCPEHLRNEVLTPVKEGELWVVVPNKYPYGATDHHLVLVPRRHVETITELSAEESAELMELLQWAVDYYELDHGAVGMRFGDTAGTGATITHMHAHLIVAEMEPDPDSKRVRFSMGPKVRPEDD